MKQLDHFLQRYGVFGKLMQQNIKATTINLFIDQLVIGISKVSLNSELVKYHQSYSPISMFSK